MEIMEIFNWSLLALTFSVHREPFLLHVIKKQNLIAEPKGLIRITIEDELHVCG